LRWVADFFDEMHPFDVSEVYVNSLDKADGHAYPIVFWSAGRVPEALRLLEEAIKRDPHYSPARALAGNCYFQLCQGGRCKDLDADGRKGRQLIGQVGLVIRFLNERCSMRVYPPITSLSFLAKSSRR
jgi:hypothetical protein